MGWKTFAVLATNQPGYFGSAPTHDPAAAEALRQQLGLDDYVPAEGTHDFDTAMYPQRGSLYIGAYPGGCILCEQDLPSAFFEDNARRKISGARGGLDVVRDRLLGLYPQGEVMALVLHSVVNLWGYSVYAQGRHLRTAAGASDNGLIANLGAPLPEETPGLQHCPIERVDEEGDGEELVFAVSARMFGNRMDSTGIRPLYMTHYRRRPRFGLSALQRFFGAR
jgi:hypothetical protein